MPYKLTWWREARHTHWRHAHWRHSTHRSSREASSQILLKQRVRLSFCVVGVCNTVDDLLCLVAGYLLVVGLDVSEMVATVVVRLAHAHTVVRKVDIAVVAEELGHRSMLVRNGWSTSCECSDGMIWSGATSAGCASRQLKNLRSRPCWVPTSWHCYSQQEHLYLHATPLTLPPRIIII